MEKNDIGSTPYFYNYNNIPYYIGSAHYFYDNIPYCIGLAHYFYNYNSSPQTGAYRSYVPSLLQIFNHQSS